MAKLGSFVNVSNIRGKLGGEVFTRGRSGATLRLRVKGTNPRTSAQTTIRSYMAAASRTAKGLSAAQKTAYVTYANSITKHNSVSGAAYSPTWETALNALFIPYKQMTPAGTFPTAPPASPYTGDTITITATGSAATITYTGSAQQTAGNKSFLMAQLLKSSNRTPSPKGYRIVNVAAIPTTPFQVPVTMTAGTYKAAYKFGLIATGQQSGLVVLAPLVLVT